MLESRIEKIFRTKIKKHGGKALKFVSPGWAGAPDRLVLLPGGYMLFAELKAPGHVFKPLQSKRAEELRELGFTVYKIDSVEAINDFIVGVFGK